MASVLGLCLVSYGTFLFRCSPTPDLGASKDLSVAYRQLSPNSILAPHTVPASSTIPVRRRNPPKTGKRPFFVRVIPLPAAKRLLISPPRHGALDRSLLLAILFVMRVFQLLIDDLSNLRHPELDMTLEHRIGALLVSIAIERIRFS